MGLAGVTCMAVATIIAYYLYNKPHRSAATATAVTITAKSLAEAYEKDETLANKKYLGNVLQVSGTVSEVSLNQQKKPVVVLAGSAISGVQCSLEEPEPGVKKGDSVIIRGFCTGLLTDVILDRCITVHNK